MTYELIVVQSFGAYPVGALVSDSAQVAAILAGEQAPCVVRIALEHSRADAVLGHLISRGQPGGAAAEYDHVALAVRPGGGGQSSDISLQ